VTHSPSLPPREYCSRPPRGAWASSLAPPAPWGNLLSPPPAPSGGAWGDASPQTPAKRTSREPRRLVMGNRLPSRALAARLPHPHGCAPLFRARHRGVRRLCWERRLLAGRRSQPSCLPPAMHTPSHVCRLEAGAPSRDAKKWRAPHPHNDFMAGVWGEASPQAPPEARWTVGRSRGASQPWAGGARNKIFVTGKIEGIDIQGG